MKHVDLFTKNPTMTNDGCNGEVDDATTLIPIEADEKATATELESVVDGASEALATIKLSAAKVSMFRGRVAAKYNRTLTMLNALTTDGRISPFLRSALMEEGVLAPAQTEVGTQPDEDLKNAIKDGGDLPEDITDKGASEEELVKTSLRARCRVLKSLYLELK